MDSVPRYRLMFAKQPILDNHEAARLFDSSHTSVESLSLSIELQKFTRLIIDNERDLDSFISRGQKSHFSFFLLRQKDSWNRIQISHHGFQKLLQSINVFSEFWPFVKGFGLKFEPKDQYAIDYKVRFHTETLSQLLAKEVELCYTIRYFDRRNAQNPKATWVERQVAIYHRLDIASLRSTWIIIQGSSGMRSGILESMSSLESVTISLLDHFSLHSFYLLDLSRNWRAYVNFLEAQLNEMDEKALHAKVGRAPRSDYVVTFRDTQNLELIRRALVKARFILVANADIGRSIRGDLDKIAEMTESDFHEILEVVQQYISSLHRQERIVTSLIDRLQGTKELLFKLLEHQYDESSIQTNMAINHNSEKLRTLTEQSFATNESMNNLTADIHNDSKLVKVLTFIAILYTPASLVATVFSSNLVQSVGSEGLDQTTKLVLSKDFWKFIVASFALMVATLLLALGWRKQWTMISRMLRKV